MDSGPFSIRGELDQYLKKHGIEIRAVLCSHAHFDHTENNSFLQKEYGAELYLSVYDSEILGDWTAMKSVFYSYTGKDNSLYNKEMMCHGDKLILPEQIEVQVDEAIFQILRLPGHAASQLGFVTPDGVAYLTDSLFGLNMLQNNKILYMLDWTRTLETLERMKTFPFEYCIVAHGGLCRNLLDLAETNIQSFSRILNDFYEQFCKLTACQSVSLDELVREAGMWYSFTSSYYVKVRVFERIIRAMTEYFLENGKILCHVRDSVIVYGAAE